jgi:uncharacterized membrane protein
LITTEPFLNYESVLHVIEFIAVAIELLAVGIIAVVLLFGTLRYVYRYLTQGRKYESYEEYRAQIGSGLLLGLEILVAADIVRTVALEPSLTNVLVLALLVLVRTFLSWSLVVEIEQRWPWQVRREEPKLGELVANSEEQKPGADPHA